MSTDTRDAAYLICKKQPVPSFCLGGGNAELRDCANAFLRSLEIRALSWRTVRAYGFDLVVFLRWLEKTKIPMSELTQAGLLGFIESQQRAAASPNTINRQLGTCEQYYRFIYDQPLQRGSGVTLPRPYYKGQGYDRLGIRWRRSTGD